MVTTNQIRDEYRLEATSVGVDKVTADAQKLVGANEAVAKSTETVERKSLSVVGALERFARANDNVYKMQQTVERGQALLNRAFDQGLAGTTAYERAVLGLIARQEQLAAMTDRAAASASRYNDVSRTQATVNASTGAGATFNSAGRAEDIAEYGHALDDLRAKFNPLFAAERQFLAIEAEITTAAKVGAISEKERGAALATARARLLDQTNEVRKSEEANARLTKGVGLNAYAWQNLSYQVNDVVTSLASGISPFQTLAQQGGQIYQILQSGQGGVGGALAAIRDRLLSISPMVGIFGIMAAGAVTAAAAIYSVAKANRDVELALLGAGKGAGLSADQINDIAIRAAKAADITVGAAREIETAFLRSGKVFGEVFLQGTVAAENFAKASGQDRAKASEFVAQSLSTLGSGGYEELAKKAGNFDARLEDQVRSLLNTGREMEAQQLVVERFGQAFDKAGEKLTTFDRLVNNVKTGASSLYDSLGRGLSGAGLDPAQKLSEIEAAIKTRRAIATSGGSDVDVSDLEAKAARIRASIKQTGDVAQAEAQRTRQNADAAAKGAVSAIVPELATLEKVRQQSAEANKALSALESSGGSSERIEAAKKAVAAAAAAERDYAAAGGPANLERAKATELLKAGFAARAAVTPMEKAEAARQQALAETYGTLTSASERNARAEDARKKVLQDASIESRNASRAQNEATRTANDLADANTRNGKSVEYLAAQRKVDEQIAAGTIDKAERETKIREQLQAQLSEVNKQTAERVRAARDQTAVQGELNDKVAAGTMVSAEAARRLASETELAKLSREADAASGEEKTRLTQRVQELRAATEAQLSAEDRTKVLSMSEDEQRRIDLLTKEAGLLGETARERQKALIVLQAEQDLKKQGISLTAPESIAYLDKVRLRADLDTAKTEYERLAQDISSAVSGIFDDMFKAGNKSLTGFIDSFSKGFSRIGTRLLEQNIIAPLIGGQGLNGQSGAGLFSGIASMFDGEKVEKAVSAGSESGIFAGLTSFLKPKGTGAANGAFSQSALGQGLVSAGVGASIGYQSQSPLMGAAGGALAGFAVGGPAGALIGGVLGAGAGFLSESEAKKQAQKKLQQELQARREALEQARPQIEALAITFEGGSQGNVGKAIADAFAQMKQAAKVASDAGDRALADRLVADFQSYVARQLATLSDGFNGTLAEVRAGFGTSGPFAMALSAVQQLGEALKAFVADAARLSDPNLAGAARAAAVEGALSSLDPPKTLSATQTELARIQGTAAGLTQVLKDLGLSADQAATAIASRTAAALDALRDKFDADLDRKINEAQGKGYLNEVADLVKEVAGLNADAGAVGGDLGRVQTYFAAAAQKIVDGSELTGAAFDDLVQRFPGLAGTVHAFAGTVVDAQAALDAIAARRAGYADRLFSATTDTDTLPGSLAAYDRQAEKDRAAEVKAGGEAINDLERAQAAERAKIIDDFNKRMLAEQQAAFASYVNRVKSYGDRLYAAVFDQNTLGGQLAIYDRNADWDRVSEQNQGGAGMADLLQAQAAERAKIINDFTAQVNQGIFDRVKAADSRYVAALGQAGSFQDKLNDLDRKLWLERLDEAKAGGQAMMELERAQAVERDNFIRQYQDAIKARASGYDDRSVAASTDSTSLSGQLTLFDRDAQRQRVDEVKAGGEAIYELEFALSSERQKIIRTYYEAVAQRQQALDDRTFAAYNDMATLAGQLAAFDRQAAADRIAEAKAGGEAMVQLEAAQSAERLKIVTEYQAQIAARAQGFADRVFAAGNDTSTLAGQLAAYDRQAAAERLAEAKAGGEAMTDLLAAQQAERLKIEKDYAKQQNDAAASALATVTKTIKTYLDNLAAGSESTLSPGDRLAAAQSQFDAQYALARGGNADALDSITTYSGNLLEAAKAMYASSDGYQDILRQIVAALNALPGSLTPADLVPSMTKAYAAGGLVTGPGTATSDSVLARLSAGEFVVNAASARVAAPWLTAVNDNPGMVPAVPMPVALPAGGGGLDLGAVLAELRALRAETRAQAEMIGRLTKAAGERVAARVEGVRDEVEAGNADRRKGQRKVVTAGRGAQAA